jgi:UDP-N-acetylglucosamine--N-acetylmuramyl-(pentapeptide) pyrophosphoryl-undecaprenol N-acetylglucosamine transferase
MKVVFTGGGTGGHVYPLIAVAQALNTIIQEENIANVRLYYFSDVPYDPPAFMEQHITFVAIPAGKRRIYASFQNFLDIFKVAHGIIVALFQLYRIYPDVVFAKGGYASFPTLVAAHLLRIPIIIHESDTVPGRVNRIAGKWATRVAVAFSQAGEYFPKEKVAHVGLPIRHELQHAITEGAYEYLKLDPTIPTVVVFGGSSGAQMINDVVISALPELLQQYQVIHQVGVKNIVEVEKMTASLLQNHEHRARYRAVGFLNALATSMAAGVASVIVSRAGSQLFEIAGWGVPAIVIPITHSNGDHQRKNAYAFAETGAGVVIEESNLTPHVLISEAHRIIDTPTIHDTMSQASQSFGKQDAAMTIAREIVNIALSHENA